MEAILRRVADWQTLARRAAHQEGIPANLFVALVNAESTGDPHALSRQGAIGYTQLMPGTARALGVNPYNPRENLLGGAKYLRQQLDRFGGNIRKALAAYNAGPGAVQKYGGVPPYAETQAYVRNILANAGHIGHIGGAATRPTRVQLPAPLTPSGLGGSTQTIAPDASSSIDVSGLLATLAQRKQPPTSMGLQPPAFSAAPALPAGYQPPSSGGGPPRPADVGSLLSLVRTPGEAAPASLTGQAPSLSGAGAAQTPVQAVRAPRGHVIVSSGANRPGVGLTKPLLGFVGRVAGIAGHPLTIGTGTNHSEYTVNGSVSDHWSGNAADIPATGHQLIRLGQDALIAAGMPAARARKQTGGGYNVGGWQVIFNTDAPGWGNHLTHLHVGRRTR